MPDECVFCAIVAGTSGVAPFADVGGDAVAFPPLRQPLGHEGYMLVVPKLHIRNLYDLPASLCGPMLGAVQRVARAVQLEFGSSGTTIRQNNEPPAQDVFHLHFHVIPRFIDDELGSTSSSRLSDEARTDQVSRLRRRLAADPAP